MINKRYYITPLICAFLLALTGCSTRSQFAEIKTADEWWQCKPLTERTWDCETGSESQVNTKTAAIVNEVLTSAAKAKTIETEKNKVLVEAPELDYEEPKNTQEVVDGNSIIAVPVVSERAKEAIGSKVSEAATPVVNSTQEFEPVITEKTNDLLLKKEVAVTNPNNRWIVQIAAFKNQVAAQKFVDSIDNAKIEERRHNGELWYRVYIGYYATKTAANEAGVTLKSNYPDLNTWVRRQH